MAVSSRDKSPKVAEVDFLVNEDGRRVDVPDGSKLKVARDSEQTVGATGPTNWWRVGIVAIAVLAAVLLVLQLTGGNGGTAMIPGTPVAAPVEQTLPQ